MATESPWRRYQSAVFYWPPLVDQLRDAGLIPGLIREADRPHPTTGSGVLSDFIDSVYRHDPRLAGPDRNPYGAHRYPRLGLIRKPRRLEPDDDWRGDAYYW